MAIERHKLTARLDDFEARKVLILGDLMLDEFTWGRVRRISPEAPVPVVEVDGETFHPGGCANVAANVKSLGGYPLTVGVVGNDDAGRRLRTLLDDLEIDSGRLVEDDRRTTLKTRIIAHGQQVVRMDREDRTPLRSDVVDTISKQFLSALGEADAVIVSDYDKGVANARLLGVVLPEAASAGVPVFLDPKVHHADYYRPVTAITPNLREAELLSGMVIRGRPSLEEAGKALLDLFGCPYILITQGEDGMSLFEDGAVYDIPSTTREVFDVSGAGDTVIATLAMAHAAGGTMEESAWLANYAAAVVVEKVGIATLTRIELESALASDSK